MCNNETHFELKQPEHQMRHTMAVQRACSMIRFGRDGVSIDDVETDAREALALADPNISVACVHMLESVLNGGLRSTTPLQSI